MGEACIVHVVICWHDRQRRRDVESGEPTLWRGRQTSCSRAAGGVRAMTPAAPRLLPQAVVAAAARQQQPIQSRRAHSPACLRPRGNRCIAVAIIVPRISTPRRSRRGQRARPRRAWPSRSSPSDLIHSPRPQVCSDETYTFLKPPLRTHRGPIQRRAFVSDHLSNTFAHPCIKIGVHPGTFSVRAGRQVALGQHTTPPGLAEGASAPPLPLRL